MAGDGGQSGCGSGGCDDVLDASRGDARGDAADFTRYEAAQALQLAFAGRIVAQKFVGETDRAQGQADGVANVSALGDGEFATAAAEIHHERGRAIDARTGDQAEVNQARFFHAGNDFNPPARSRAHPLEKRLRIAGVAQGAGGDHAHRVGDDLLRGAVEAAQHLHGFGHRLGSEESSAKHAFAEARDFAVFVQRAKASALQARNFQAHGVGADIDCGERGHGPSNGKLHSLHAGGDIVTRGMKDHHHGGHRGHRGKSGLNGFEFRYCPRGRLANLKSGASGFTVSSCRSARLREGHALPSTAPRASADVRSLARLSPRSR